MLSMLIVSAQLTDTYIRWLSFSAEVSLEVKRRLWQNYFVWGVASFFLYNFLFERFTICAATYKAILMSGWLPYFLISLRIIRNKLPQHTFVFGMGVICSLMQHTICAVIILSVFKFQSDAEIIFAEAAGYLLLFAIFLPVCGKYFINLLPSRELFDLRPLGIYIAILPLIIVSGHLIRLADDVLVHSWTERLSRIYLPVAFLFFYRYILLATKNFYDLQKLKRNKLRLKEQLTELREHNEQIQADQKLAAIMRHDLRHSYNLIYAMLESGNVDKAREHISKQEKIISAGGGGS